MKKDMPLSYEAQLRKDCPALFKFQEAATFGGPASPRTAQGGGDPSYNVDFDDFEGNAAARGPMEKPERRVKTGMGLGSRLPQRKPQQDPNWAVGALTKALGGDEQKAVSIILGLVQNPQLLQKVAQMSSRGI